MGQYKIIDENSGEDVTEQLKNEFKNTLKAKTDVEMHKAWGNKESTIPSDKETRAILQKNLLMKILNISPFDEDL